MLLTLQASEAELVVDYKDWQIPLGRRFRCASKVEMTCVYKGFYIFNLGDINIYNVTRHLIPCLNDELRL